MGSSIGFGLAESETPGPNFRDKDGVAWKLS